VGISLDPAGERRLEAGDDRFYVVLPQDAAVDYFEGED
jgi:hypothetical protein